jgi:hypothetical protein
MNLQDEKQTETQQALERFSKAIGKSFRIKDAGVDRVDEVIGIEWPYRLVKGKKYGDYHVDYCQLLP